jgi:hypothetical protein
MTETTQPTTTTRFTIGSKTTCSDGACGQLRRVVVEPVGRVLTHLVVEPRRERATGRLVPIGLVESVAGEIRLRCTLAEFETLEYAEETQFLQGASGTWGYDQEHLLSWPRYPLGPAAGMTVGTPGNGMVGLGMSTDISPQEIASDRVPPGEVEVRRGEQVHATDGDIGRVRGLVVDSEDDHVTHVLLDEGHLWGRKQVAIPIGAVQSVDHGVRLDLSKDEVRDLPAVDIVHQG